MDLVAELNEHIGDEDRTINALGIVFMDVRLSMKPEDYRTIRGALPESEVWVKRALSGSAARTGEMLALQSADFVRSRLVKIGLDDRQIEQLVEGVHRVLEPILGTSAFQALVAKMPLLSRTPS